MSGLHDEILVTILKKGGAAVCCCISQVGSGEGGVLFINVSWPGGWLSEEE